MIYHITHLKDWKNAVAVGSYSANSLTTEGFIHCSTRQQVIDTANYRFDGMTDLVLLEVDEPIVNAEIVYENLDGGERLFPHIYGELNLDAVVAAIDFPCDHNGLFHFPGE